MVAQLDQAPSPVTTKRPHPNLLLHCSGRAVRPNEVQLVPTPTATETWTPIPHLDLVTQVEHTIRANGLAIGTQAHKGVAIPAPGQRRNHDPESGECRLFPQHGVVLVVTDERGCEACFGFFKFPEHITDIHGAILADTGLEGRWWFRDFVDSADSRYRKLVSKFSERGFSHSVKDEFA